MPTGFYGADADLLYQYGLGIHQIDVNPTGYLDALDDASGAVVEASIISRMHDFIERQRPVAVRLHDMVKQVAVADATTANLATDASTESLTALPPAS